MLIGLASALVLAAQPVPDLSADPDLRCFMAVAIAAGSLRESEKGDAAMQAGLASVMLYYVGKLEGRFPGIELKRQLTRLIQLPGFQRSLPAEMQRCGKEAEERGAALQDLGSYLQDIAPLLDAKPG